MFLYEKNFVSYILFYKVLFYKGSSAIILVEKEFNFIAELSRNFLGTFSAIQSMP
jgi:hypothetical protein